MAGLGRVAVEQATQSQAAEWIDSSGGMRVAANSVGGNGKISTHSVLRTCQEPTGFAVNDVFTCRHFLMDYAEASSEFLICPASSRIVACLLLVVVVVERDQERPSGPV